MQFNQNNEARAVAVCVPWFIRLFRGATFHFHEILSQSISILLIYGKHKASIHKIDANYTARCRFVHSDRNRKYRTLSRTANNILSILMKYCVETTERSSEN